MKKLITVLSVAFILLSMSACSVETSSTSTSTFTTTTTDADGNTTETTTTTTTENGVTTSNTLTTSADDPTGLRSKWKEYFTAGAEGVSKDGLNIYMIMDDPENITLSAIMITSPENGELLEYVYGEVVVDEETAKIIDVEEDINLPFQIGESDQENCFELIFQDGDSAVMEMVDLDTIVDDMISIWEVQRDDYQAAHGNSSSN